MGHGGKNATAPRLNPSPHPQAGGPSGSTYLGNLSNHYPPARYPARAAKKSIFDARPLKGRLIPKNLRHRRSDALTRNRLRASAHAQRNDVGSGDQRGGDL